MDPFQEIPPEKWSILQKKLTQSWPTNISGYYALYANLQSPKLREAFQFKVYCPEGKLENGFIATSVKADITYIIVFPTSEDVTKLKEALKKTQLVDWTKRLHVEFVTAPIANVMNILIQDLRSSNISINKYLMKLYYLEKNTKLFEDVRCPPETYLSSIDQSDIQRVNDTWPYKHSASYFYFSTLASCNLSYGLYSRVDHKLLAWIFLNEYNYLNHLYCEKEQRKKGYAEYLMKYVINNQLRLGNDLYAFVAHDNQKSSALFEKLGFAYTEDISFIAIPIQMNKL